LTDTGRLYLEYCRQLRETLVDAERAVSAVRTEVAGRLRVTGPTSLGEVFLTDLVLEFQRRHPAVAVELDLSVTRRDLAADGYDAAIRATRAVEGDLVARPLGVMREVVVASPAFLSRVGRLDEPEDLSRVPCAINSQFSDDRHWVFERGGAARAVSVAGPLTANYYPVFRRAALTGAAAARLPLCLVRDELLDGRLARVCAGYELLSLPLYLLYPARKNPPRRARAFIDFALEWFARPEQRALLE
jgi:DNA-binding transcriptional LysR family regulator